VDRPARRADTQEPNPRDLLRLCHCASVFQQACFFYFFFNFDLSVLVVKTHACALSNKLTRKGTGNAGGAESHVSNTPLGFNEKINM
jgi:hypothetical protein